MTRRLPRLASIILLVVLASAPAVAAQPRDELLRLAPPDAAIVALVQNARDHLRAVAGSPFAAWLPTTPFGKDIPGEASPKLIEFALTPILGPLGTSLEELRDDVLGDAIGFAYSPAPAADPKAERAVLLVRPRKPDTLRKLVDRVNELQTGSKELASVARKEHRGQEYWERRETGGKTEYYTFRGPVFAFSGTESDIRAVIDRDLDAPRNGTPDVTARLTKLGVADALAVVLVNPRPLDAELAAKVAEAKPDEKVFLRRFADLWAGLDAAAVYLSLGADAELGLALDFRPDALPADARAWLTGPRSPSPLWAAVPDNALVAATARFRASDLLAAVRSVLPDEGRAAVDKALADTIGPAFGRDRLPRVLDALGPDWAVWVEPPAAGQGFLPVAVGAVKVSPAGPDTAGTEKAIRRAARFAADAVAFAYNRDHPDQIEVAEESDGDGTLTVLTGGIGFPPGVRPAFAFKDGYFVLASHPDAVRRFKAPDPSRPAAGQAVLARFSGPAARDYLRTHGAELAGFLARHGQGAEKELRGQVESVTKFLELVDRVELVTIGTDTGVRLALRAKLAKPLE
ncbi:MAG: hypothetical protein K2X87_17270 [Gemmataceae bacterium]|nr:hypothetical protein [Gemmataceae bacterium]